MMFDSTVFLFIFLPVSLILHSLVPERARNLILVVLSLIFYAWGSPVHVLLLLAVSLWNYVGGLLVAGRRKKPKIAKKTAVMVIAADILVLLVFKYISRLFGIAGSGLADSRFLLPPIGISFFMLQNIAYVADILRGEARAQRSVVNYLVFITMFPKVIAGPLVSCGEFERQLTGRKVTWHRISEGLLLFVQGLAKKAILGSALAELFHAVFDLPGGEISLVSAWLGCLAFALYMSFSFGGYCDMAVGLGRMFGFELPENVMAPYLSSGIMDYWSRWMPGLWNWFCSYVYLPLCGGNPIGAIGFGSLAATWILIGIWHGLSLSFVLWGLFFAVLLYLEGFVLGDVLERIPAVVRWLVTMLLVMISWVFFFSGSAGHAFRYLGLMLGIGGHGLCDAAALTLIRSHAVLLLLSLLVSLPVAGRLYEKALSLAGRWQTAACSAVYVLLFLLSAACIMGGAPGEFFYFRF